MGHRVMPLLLLSAGAFPGHVAQHSTLYTQRQCRWPPLPDHRCPELLLLLLPGMLMLLRLATLLLARQLPPQPRVLDTSPPAQVSVPCWHILVC